MESHVSDTDAAQAARDKGAAQAARGTAAPHADREAGTRVVVPAGQGGGAAFDTTPNPRAIEQLVPDKELVKSLYSHQDRALSRELAQTADLFLADDDRASLQGLADLCSARAATYALLARLYGKEVDQGLLDTLIATDYPVSTGVADADEGYRLIATYLSGTWEGTLTELAADYVHAFIGSNGGHVSAAYPFESVYRSDTGLLMQDARDEALALYRTAGLEKAGDWPEGEDHICAELEYMRVLSQRCSEVLADAVAGDAADEEGAAGGDAVMWATRLLRAQKSFMDCHLAKWVPAFTADVERFAKQDFYKGLAKVTRGFIAQDALVLGEVLVARGADATGADAGADAARADAE